MIFWLMAILSFISFPVCLSFLFLFSTISLCTIISSNEHHIRATIDILQRLYSHPHPHPNPPATPTSLLFCRFHSPFAWLILCIELSFFISFRLGNVVVERFFFLFFSVLISICLCLLTIYRFASFTCSCFVCYPFSTLASFGVVSVVVVVVVVLTFKSILIKFFPAIFQFDVFPFLLFILSLIFGINSDDAPLPYCHFISPFWHLFFVWPLSWYFFALIDSCVWLGLPCSLDSVVFYTGFHQSQSLLSPNVL